MIRYKVLQILFLVSSMTSQVIHSMMPQDISKSPPQETSHINSMPFQVEGIVKIVHQLPKELWYKIISFALELQVNKKYEVYKKFDVGSHIVKIAFNADNTRLLTVSDDKIARLWDVEKGIVLKELNVHAGNTISSVALSADNCIALTGSPNEIIRVLNINTGKLLKTIQAGSYVNSVLLSADGKTAITVSDFEDVLIWNTLTGKLISNFKVNSIDRSIALSADGKIALIGSLDVTAQVWNTNTGKLLKTLQVGSPLFSMALNADGTIAAIGTYDGKVLVWDVKSGTLLNTLLITDRAYSIAFSKDGKRALVVTKDNTIQVWNTQPLSGKKETSTPLTVLEGHTWSVRTVAFGGADFIASGSEDDTALIWKPFLENHYWPLKEGKIDWKALTEQEIATYADFRETFYKQKHTLLQESISCDEANLKPSSLGKIISYLLG